MESTAILLLWLLFAEEFGIDLSQVVVLTAVTGDEYPTTLALVNKHIVPLLASRGVRWVQVARRGDSEDDGYDVLSDAIGGPAVSRGLWPVSQEYREGGTLVQRVGKHVCALKHKGYPLDSWVADHVLGEYEHAIGYNASETRRIERDSGCYGAGRSRRARYPLQEIGWDREDCIRFIRDVLGVTWLKSCCVQCPFQPSGPIKGPATAERWMEIPDTVAEILIAEVAAIALNPRTSTWKERTAGQFVDNFGMVEARRRAESGLELLPWSVVEVRRVVPESVRSPGKPAPSWRSVHVISTCDREEARYRIGRLAELERAEVEEDVNMIRRAWVRRHEGPALPVVEHFYAAAPAGMLTKERKDFEKVWQANAHRRPRRRSGGARRP